MNIKSQCDRPVSDQEAPKYGDDAIDRVKKLLKRWDDGFSFNNLAERYLELKLRVHVHCRLVPRDSGNSKQFCAMFEGAASGRQLNRTGNIAPIGNGGGGYEKSVLVQNVKAMEPPEYISFPSLVWFQFLDDLNHFGAGARYFSGNLGLCLGDSLDIPPDREGGVLVDGALTNSGQFASKMIERGSQIVNRVADNCERTVREALSDDELAYAVSGLGIVVGMNTIGVQIEETPQFSCEVIDVLFGPMGFGSN